MATGEDVSTAQLLIEADGHWREHLGHPFDAALIPELVRLTNEVLSLMREKALPAKSGSGFRFNVE